MESRAVDRSAFRGPRIPCCMVIRDGAIVVAPLKRCLGNEMIAIVPSRRLDSVSAWHAKPGRTNRKETR
jgi:hypothetical protein